MDTIRYAEQLAAHPNEVLDTVIEHLHLKNDAALSRELELAPPVISKFRHSALTFQPLSG